MPRSARILPTEGMIHLIGRSNNKMNLFHDSNDFTQFRHIILRFIENKPFFIHHYVFMHTHYHLLAWIEDTKQLASIMKSIAVSYNYYYRKRYNFHGHLWHSRFRSIVIEDESHWAACGRYIELNPIRAGTTIRPERFPWSSYHHYAFGKHDPLLKPIKGLPLYDQWIEGKNSADYRAFIMAGINMDQNAMRKIYSTR